MAGNHLDSSKPHLMSSFTDKWPCRSWTFKTLADLLKNKTFSCRIAPKSCDQTMETQCSHQDVTIKEFCDWLDGTANDSSPLRGFTREDNSCYIDYKYMKDMFEEHPDMFEEVQWEDFGLVGLNGYDSTIWLGSEGANTPGHQDTYGFNLITQVYGRKLWILFAPEDSQHLYPTRVPYEESSIFTEVNIRRPDLLCHPRFQCEDDDDDMYTYFLDDPFVRTTLRGISVGRIGTRRKEYVSMHYVSCELSHPYVVTLQPGQTLYVPRHWWHYVESLEPSISINVWVPLKEDGESRFSEAVTRCLATSLISSLDTSYTGSLKSEWLNPTENLAPTAMNLLLLKTSLCQLLENGCLSEHIPKTDEKQNVNEDSLCKNELLQQGDLQHALIQQGDLQHGLIQQGDLQHVFIQQGDLQHGLIQQGDLQHELIQQGDLQHGLIQQGDLQHGLIQQGDFQGDEKTQTADDSESQSQQKMCYDDNGTSQHVQEAVNTGAGNALASINLAGQSERTSDESMLSLFTEKMKGYQLCTAGTPFQCDFEVRLPLKRSFDSQLSSLKKVKLDPALAIESASGSEDNLPTETRITSLSPCSFNTYLRLLNNLCRQNQCSRCCIDRSTSNDITVNSRDRHYSLTHTEARTANVSQHESSASGQACFETVNARNSCCLEKVCSAVSHSVPDSQKWKASFDFEDEACGRTSGDGSGMKEDLGDDTVSEFVDSDSLAAGGCSQLSQLEVAETILSCTLHPDVVKLISRLFRDQCQRRLKLYK